MKQIHHPLQTLANFIWKMNRCVNLQSYNTLKKLNDTVDISVPSIVVGGQIPSGASVFDKCLMVRLEKDFQKTIVPSSSSLFLTDGTDYDFDDPIEKRVFRSYAWRHFSFRELNAMLNFFGTSKYDMLAHALVISLRVKLTMRKYDCKEQIQRMKVMNDPFIKDKEEVKEIVQFLKDVVKINKRMIDHPELESSERSQWMLWSVFGDKYEKDHCLRYALHKNWVSEA